MSPEGKGLATAVATYVVLVTIILALRFSNTIGPLPVLVSLGMIILLVVAGIIAGFIVWGRSSR